MSSITDRLEAGINQTTVSFRNDFATLSVEQLNWKPAPGEWSIAQNIHHLIAVNSTYFPVIETVRRGDYQIPFWGKNDGLVRFFGNMILKSVLPDTKRKIKTFAVWQPSLRLIEGDILDRFVSHQSSLIDIMKSCEDLISKGVIIHSPASRIVVYKLEKAFEIIVAHEQRHLNQARRVHRQMEISLKKEK